MRTHRVFVYGSLMSGMGNNGVMLGAGGRLLGPARTAPAFTLRDVSGAYPAMLDRGCTPVLGEVWWVPDAGLTGLDRLEGYQPGRRGNLYDRATIRLDEGTAYAYLWPLAREGRLGVEVPRGDWRAYLALLRSVEDGAVAYRARYGRPAGRQPTVAEVVALAPEGVAARAPGRLLAPGSWEVVASTDRCQSCRGIFAYAGDDGLCSDCRPVGLRP